MGVDFYLWQGIHVVTNPATNSLANMLYVIKSFDNAIIFNAEEKGTAQAIDKSTFLSKVRHLCSVSCVIETNFV